MSGPGRKPSSLKVIAGTVRPDRDGEAIALPALTTVPPPVDWLPNAHAVKEWERLAPILVANGLLTEAGLSAFGLLCSLHGKQVQLWAAGETPLSAMVAQHRALMNDFGLTPVAQGKVKPAGEGPAKNAFSRNGRRAAA